MKIAIIVNPLIPVPPRQYGGIERIVDMLIKELLPQHEVVLFAHPGSTANCKLIPYRESLPYGVSDMLKINLLTAQIAFQGFDVVHTFGRMSNIGLLMLTKIPKVVSYQLPPTLSQIKKAVKIAPKNSLYFTACSRYIERQIAACCQSTTIYNGIDTTEYQFNDHLQKNAPLIFLGRIQVEKGTDIAIKVAKATGKNLIIAGNIPNEAVHQQYFEEQVKPYIDNEQITYVGPVDNLQKNTLLRHALAFLMPVTWDEPFGIVMTEALACGTPIVGFNRGAVPEVVEHDINGFVCETAEEMIQAVGRVSQISRKTCRNIAETKFSSKVLAKQYLELYQTISGKH